MDRIKKGEKVLKKIYENDIIFEVKKIFDNKNVLLKGVTERIEIDSSIEDLKCANKEEVRRKLNKFEAKFNNIIVNDSRNIEECVTGKILHLDGDRRYSEKSLKYYQKVGLRAIVKNIPEYKQPKMVYFLLLNYKPDILIITGHDGMIRKGTNFNNIYNYRNSKYFIETVKEARKFEKDIGKELVIFAGACQSYYEALMMAGANFASSPARVLIDIMDPLIVAEIIATTNEYKYVSMNDLEKRVRDGKKGIGGIGAMRKEKNNNLKLDFLNYLINRDVLFL